MDLTAISEDIRARFDAKNAAREKGLHGSRAAIRFCANSIRAVHRGEVELAAELRASAKEALTGAQRAMRDFPEIYYVGYLQDAEKEYAEAVATAALVAGEPIPGPGELEVGDAPYLNGLAEAIGELRRTALDVMREGDLARGEALLGAMDDIYYVLISMDYPDAVTGGLRRSTDVARSIIERTRGDLTITLVQRSLQDALADHKASLQP